MEIKRAQEINPLSLMDLAIGGWTYYHARQFDKAIAEGKRALEMDRSFGNGYMVLVIMLDQKSDEQKAMGNAMEVLCSETNDPRILRAMLMNTLKILAEPQAPDLRN